MPTHIMTPAEQQSADDLARNTLMHADAYFGAAVRAAQGLTGPEIVALQMPINFLFGHACELALKALLLAKGHAEAELKRVGHDLLACISACRAEGVDVLPDFEIYCQIMNRAHSQYLTRYELAKYPWVGFASARRQVEPQLWAVATLLKAPMLYAQAPNVTSQVRLKKPSSRRPGGPQGWMGN